MRRLQELRDVDVLEFMRRLPQADCHELLGDRKGQLAVNVQFPFRLIFKIANEPVPVRDDGGIDWTRVTAIRILEVVDYHGR